MLRRVDYSRFPCVIPDYIGIIGGLGTVLEREYQLFPENNGEIRAILRLNPAHSPKHAGISGINLMSTILTVVRGISQTLLVLLGFRDRTEQE